MKYFVKSFLFFCLLPLMVIGLNQEKEIDSTSYYYRMAINPQKSNDLSNAYEYYLKLYNKSSEDNNSITTVQNLRILAIVSSKSGFYSESENFAIEALKILDELVVNQETIEAKIGILNHLGRVHRNLKEYDSALEYYNKVLEITSDPKHRSIVLNNRAKIFKEKQQFQLAVNEYSKAYEISLIANDIKEIARALDNLGFMQSFIDHSDAFNSMITALEMRIASNDLSGLYSSYKHISEYYKNRNDYGKAQEFAQKALKTSQLINSESFKFDALSLLTGLSENPHVKEYIRMNDSINLSEILNENKYSTKKYNLAKKESELKEVELQKEKEKSNRIIFQALGIFILLTALFLFYILKLKHKKDKLLQVYNTETRISKKVHDEVANDVFQFMSKLQGESNTSEKLIDDIEHIYNKARDISKEYHVLDSGGNFETVLNDLILSFNNPNTNVMAKGISKIEWASVSKIKRITIYKVLQELLINMKKHSLASVAVLAFNQERRKIEIVYKDNGEGGNIVKGTGLQNVENRIASINGRVIFESKINKGFKAQIVI